MPVRDTPIGVLRRTSLAVAALAIAGLSCANDEASPPAAPTSWHVKDGAIRDKSGRSVVLRGVNFAGTHKWKPYLSEFGASDMARLRDDFGFDAIRFLVTWAAIEPNKGTYDDQYIDGVEERIRAARDAGLLVVVDMHQDLYGEGFAGGDGAPRWTCDEAKYAAFVPKQPWFLGSLDKNVMQCVDGLYEEGGENRARFVDAWKHLAKRLASYENIVGFDVLNEPNWGTYSILAFEIDKLAGFYTEVAKAVREIAPTWLVFAEPGASRNVGYASNLPKLPFENAIVYAPHSYDRDAESGSGFDPARREAIIENLKAMRAEADALGAALWIGEYGGVAEHPGITPYMDAQFDAAGAVAAGTTYWALDKGQGYSLLTADGAEKKELADVLVRPYPTRVAGKLLSYGFDEATKTATIRVVVDASISEPTEIVAPKRVYAKGANVSCGGCTVEGSSGTLRLKGLPAGEIEIRLDAK